MQTGQPRRPATAMQDTETACAWDCGQGLCKLPVRECAGTYLRRWVERLDAGAGPDLSVAHVAVEARDALRCLALEAAVAACGGVGGGKACEREGRKWEGFSGHKQ